MQTKHTQSIKISLKRPKITGLCYVILVIFFLILIGLYVKNGHIGIDLMTQSVASHTVTLIIPAPPPITGSTGMTIIGTTSYQNILSTNLATAIPSMFHFESGTSTVSATSTKVATTVDNLNIAVPPPVNMGGTGTAPVVMQTLIPRATQMTDSKGVTFDATQLKIADKKNEISLSTIANSTVQNTTTADTFPPLPAIVLRAAMEFGIPGKTLYFSQPIKLNISVDPSLNGMTLKVKRSSDNGATWMSEGITQSALNGCTEGIGSHPVSEVIVMDGIVTIYSCRSSYFAAYIEGPAPPPQPAPAPSSGWGGGSSFTNVPPIPNIPAVPALDIMQNPLNHLPAASKTPISAVQITPPTSISPSECTFLKANQQSTDAVMVRRVQYAAKECAKLYKSDACMFLTFKNGSKNTYVLSKFAFAQNACDKKRVIDPCGFFKRYTDMSSALSFKVMMAKKECKKVISNFEKACLYVDKYATSKNKKITDSLQSANKICLMYKSQDPCGFSKKFDASQYSQLKSSIDDAKQMCASIPKNVAIKKTQDRVRAVINSPGDVDRYAIAIIDEAIDISEVLALSHTPEEIESLSSPSEFAEEKEMQDDLLPPLDIEDFNKEDEDFFEAPESSQVDFAQVVTGNEDTLQKSKQENMIFRTLIEVLGSTILTVVLILLILGLSISLLVGNIKS